MIRSPLLVGLAVFGAVLVIIVYLSSTPEAATQTTQLVILAGLVLSFLDRHMRDNVTVKELKQNTEMTQQNVDLTKQIPGKIAQEASKVAKDLVIETGKTIDQKIDAKQGSIAEVIAEKTSDLFTKAFNQGHEQGYGKGYEAGQEALRREIEKRNPPSF